MKKNKSFLLIVFFLYINLTKFCDFQYLQKSFFVLLIFSSALYLFVFDFPMLNLCQLLFLLKYLPIFKLDFQKKYINKKTSFCKKFQSFAVFFKIWSLEIVVELLPKSLNFDFSFFLLIS